MQFDENVIKKNSILVKALSPITVYSTYEKRDGTKITHYFSPWDKVFEHLIEENFARKYQAFTGTSLDDEKSLITIRRFILRKKKFANTIKRIAGWNEYELKGKEYLSFILDAGIGAKSVLGLVSSFL